MAIKVRQVAKAANYSFRSVLLSSLAIGLSTSKYRLVLVLPSYPCISEYYISADWECHLVSYLPAFFPSPKKVAIRYRVVCSIRHPHHYVVVSVHSMDSIA